MDYTWVNGAVATCGKCGQPGTWRWVNPGFEVDHSTRDEYLGLSVHAGWCDVDVIHPRKERELRQAKARVERLASRPVRY